MLVLDIENRRIINGPWSGQKILKFGFYSPINEKDEMQISKEIEESFSKEAIFEMLDLLINPSQESIESLVWLPERIKNKNF